MKEDDGSNVAGYSYINGICSGSRYSIAEDHGGFGSLAVSI